MFFRKKDSPPGGPAGPRPAGARFRLPPAAAAAAAQIFIGALLLILYFVTFWLPYALAALCPLCGGLVTLSLELFRPGDGRGFREAASRILPAFLTLAVLGAGIFFLTRMTSIYRLTWAGAAAAAAFFTVELIVGKLTLSAVSEDDPRTSALLRTSASLSAAARLSSALIFAAAAVKLLGFYDLTKYLSYALFAVFVYSAVFILISLTVRTVRREMATGPDLSIPLPFSRKRDFRITGYLEKNTGITMHSLWSMKFIWSLMPYTVIFVVLTVWLATAVTLVDSGQQAVVYRCGRLIDEPLKPGIHLTLPFPLDRVEKYPTDAVKKLTVGYISNTDSDNIWTDTHGSEEFQLLLGGGNELVSVNLRIEYKISDLIAYLKSSADPVKLLEATAYNLITDRVIRTDLETLMAQDRRGFAESLEAELSRRISQIPDAGGTSADLGISVVSVVLESIHPPISVASVYQELISSNIKAGRIILDAEAYAATAVAEAEKTRNTALLEAEAGKSTSVAAARASVAEFMASVEADANYKDTYRYEKYLSALTARASGASRLIILGEGIDRKDIWIGSPSLLTD